MSDTKLTKLPATDLRPEDNATAFPLPTGPGFDEHLYALDHGYSTDGAARPVHRARPFRVLLLALFAVLIVLMMATVAAAAAWKLADERYVDEVVRENF